MESGFKVLGYGLSVWDSGLSVQDLMASRAGVSGSGCGGPKFSGSRGCFRSLTSLHRPFGGRLTVSLYSKWTLLGTPNREPQEYSRNIMGYKDPGRYIPIIYLLYSWGSPFGVPSRVPLYSKPLTLRIWHVMVGLIDVISCHAGALHGLGFRV